MPATPSVSPLPQWCPSLGPHDGTRGGTSASAAAPSASKTTALWSSSSAPTPTNGGTAGNGVGVLNAAGHGDTGVSSSSSMSLTTVMAPHSFGAASPTTPVPLLRSPRLGTLATTHGRDGAAAALPSRGLSDPPLTQNPRLPRLGEGPPTPPLEQRQLAGQQPPPPLPAHPQQQQMTMTTAAATRPLFSPRATPAASPAASHSVSSSITAPVATANTSVISAAGSPGLLAALISTSTVGGAAAAAAAAAAPLSPSPETPLVRGRSAVSTIAPSPSIDGAAASCAGAAASTASASAPAAARLGPPYAGVYLQPSTFRLGATAPDVLWALYRSNGVVAAYVDGDDPHAHGPDTLEEVPSSSISGHADAAEAVAEIARCLGAAGSSTPVLLSFDYTITPARRRTLTELEASTQRAHPLSAQLTAKGVNAMEEVVLGSSAPPDHIDDDLATGATSLEKQRWLRGLSSSSSSSSSATPGASSGPDATRARQRRCAEAVQATLLAARRAGIAQRLAFCEPVPDGSAGPTAKGSMARVLCGGRCGSGAADTAAASPLGTGPVWLGIQAALHSMLVGEEATFLIGPADSAMFSAPLDTAAYVRSATAAGGGSSTGGGGGGGGWPAGERRRASFSQANQSQRSVVTFPRTGVAAAAAVTGVSNGGAAAGGGGGGAGTAAGDRTRRGRGTAGGCEGPNGSTDSGPPPVRRRRACSNSSVHHSTASFPSTRSSSTLASLRSSLSDVDRAPKSGKSKKSKTSTQQPPPQQQQQEQQHKRQHTASRRSSQPDGGSRTPGGGSSVTEAPLRKSTFLSRVREWSRRGSRAGGEVKATSTIAPLQRPPSPTMSSSTSSTPLPRCAPNKLQSPSLDAAVRSLASVMPVNPAVPLFSSTDGRLGHSALSGHQSSPGSAKSSHHGGGVAFTAVHSQPPQHTPTLVPAASKLSAPPSAAAADVLAYEVVSHASAEPVMVQLRLRERVPMLPLRTTGQHAPPLLVSAAPAPTRASLVTAPSCLSSVAAAPKTTPHTGGGGTAPPAAHPAPRPPPSSPVPLSTDALRCLQGTNLLRPVPCTPFHHLSNLNHLAPNGAAAGASPRPRERTPPSAGAPTALASAAVAAVTVAELMRGILLRPAMRNAARTALFTAVALAMDGKLLGACDGARTLRDAVSSASSSPYAAATAARTAVQPPSLPQTPPDAAHRGHDLRPKPTGNLAEMVGSALVGREEVDGVGNSGTNAAAAAAAGAALHGGGEEAVLMTTSPTHTVIAQVPAAVATSLPNASPLGSPDPGAALRTPGPLSPASVPEEPAELPGHVWLPSQALAVAVRDFTAHLRGDRHNARGGGVAGGAGDRAAATGLTKGPHSHAAGPAEAGHRDSPLHRALLAFTRYAHETSPAEFSLSVFDASRGVYVPYVHPLRAAAASAAAATAVTVTSGTGAVLSRPHDPAVLRGGIGCVLYPCWLDAVLQSGLHRRGADIDVITHGHASEAEERLYIGGIVQEVAGAAGMTTRRVKAALAAAAATTSTTFPLSNPPPLSAHALAGGGGAGGGGGGVDAALSFTTRATPTMTPSPGAATPAVASTPRTAPPLRTPDQLSRRGSLHKSCNGARERGGGGGGGASSSSRAASVAPRDPIEDTAELLARRRLAGTAQLLAARRSEQRYRVHVRACQPLLSPQHFFALSAKDGLAAARALLVDAAVLISYYHEALATLSAPSLSAAPPPSSASGLDGLHLQPTVPAVVRRGAQFEVRGQRSQHRLPYLLFGDEPRALMAAAAARAQAMGARCSFQSVATSTVGGALPAGVAASAASASLSLSLSHPAAHRGGAEWVGSSPSPTASTRLSTPEVPPVSPRATPPPTTASSIAAMLPPASAVPPIELLAAAMMFVAPSAAARAGPLAARVPQALERVLLKALPKLHLAVFLLTFGIDEAAVVPAGLLERQHGSWWAKLSATAAVSGGSAGEEGVASRVRRTSPPRREATGATVSTMSGGGGGGEGAAAGRAGEDDARLQYRRYMYLGECFSHIAFACAELPGMRAVAREACTLALLYLPRSVALWALWATMAERLGYTTDAQDAMRIVIGLAALEEAEETEGRTPAGRVPARPGEGPPSRQLLSPVAAPVAAWPPTSAAAAAAAAAAAPVPDASPTGRSALLQYARGVLQAAECDAAQPQPRRRRSVANSA